jgi:hypothetical protein
VRPPGRPARFGTDLETSVLDTDARRTRSASTCTPWTRVSSQHQAVNTLTAMANALRVGDHCWLVAGSAADDRSTIGRRLCGTTRRSRTPDGSGLDGVWEMKSRSPISAKVMRGQERTTEFGRSRRKRRRGWRRGSARSSRTRVSPERSEVGARSARICSSLPGPGGSIRANTYARTSNACTETTGSA